MASYTKRPDGHWQARIRKKGHKGQFKTFRTKAAAERWANLTESEMKRGVFISTAIAEQTLFSDLLDRYITEIIPTKKSQRQAISMRNGLRRSLGHLSVAAITPQILAHYRDERLNNVKGHTVRKDLLLIRRILTIASKEWEIPLPLGNPVTLITVPTQPKGRERRLEGNEEELILAGASEYGGVIKEVIIFAIETGMRRSELCRLDWKDINLKKHTALLYYTKNTEDRTVPLSSTAMRVLSSLPRNINDLVFGLRPDSITQAFKRICKRAGIEGLHFHDLRHEATSSFFEKGLSIMEVSSITGHKDLAMLRRYTHLKAEDLVSKLG